MAKNFKNFDSLKGVRDVLSEAGEALKDNTRTIRTSTIPDVLSGALGAGVGGLVSFTALFYGGAITGISAAGITSGLAAAGGIVGGGMVAGVFVLAAPVALLGGLAYGVTAAYHKKKLLQEKERLYNEALLKHQAIIDLLKDRSVYSAERINYLESINILLRKAIQELKEDLNK